MKNEADPSPLTSFGFAQDTILGMTAQDKNQKPTAQKACRGYPAGEKVCNG